MKKQSQVAKSLMMVTQIGLTMLVPLFLCVAAGVWLDRRLGTVYFLPVFLVLGIGAAFRNVYYLTKQFYAQDKKKEDEQLGYIEALKREGAEHRNERTKIAAERMDGAAADIAGNTISGNTGNRENMAAGVPGGSDSKGQPAEKSTVRQPEVYVPKRRKGTGFS